MKRGYDPTHIGPSAQWFGQYVGQEILNGDVGGGFEESKSLMLFAGWFHYHKVAPKLAWFQDVESMLNHHLAGLLGLGSLSCGIKASSRYVLHTAIQLQPVFAQWIQNTPALAPGATAPGATASTSLTWWGGDEAGGKVALLLIPLGTADFLAYHIHAFTIHVTVLIFLKVRCLGVSDQGVVTHITEETLRRVLLLLMGGSAISYGTGIPAQDPTTRRIWFGIVTAHDFESHDDITEERLYQNIFASHFGQLAIIFCGLPEIRFHVAWQGNFESWVQDPLHRLQLEQNEDNVLARMLDHKEAIISHLSWASLFLGFHTLGLYVHNDVMLAFGTPEKQILIEPIFAQWIQSAHGKTSYELMYFIFNEWPSIQCG
ncbi:hypothetical protein HAX54_047857 [Datura stramonium]|uniref:Uncharacterized protein n=1 Tax=Datura stramonium TaxID=4076 RepID=A0ABS8ST46_DATST|nr:hypothetical protein [Datura stramonium]